MSIMDTLRFIHGFTQIYNLLWKAALPFLEKNNRLKQGFDQRISQAHLKKADLWIHGASAGEAFLAIEIVKNLCPDKNLKILITTTTLQGMEILKKGLADYDESNAITNTSRSATYNIQCKITWFPFDMPDIMEKAVSKIDPRLMVILETELWPGLLFALKQKKINIIVINARISSKSYERYLKTSFLWDILAPNYIIAISEQDKYRFSKIFANTKIEIMPNIKFDVICKNHKKQDTTEGPLPPVFPKMKSNPAPKLYNEYHCKLEYPMSLLVSVHKEEEDDTANIIKKLIGKFPDQIIGLFPRHMHRIENWKTKLNNLGIPWQLRSEIKEKPEKRIIILWDIFGELKKIYPFAITAFIGGSLKPLGGHNFIESVISGTATVTGPYTDDFNWVGNEIFKKELVKKVKNWKDVSDFMIENLKTPRDRNDLIRQAERFMRDKTGGTDIACRKIKEFLP